MGLEYDSKDIEVLEGLSAVRKRPGMYIGNTSERGLHHLVYEVVDNAIDEAMAGYCDKIKVIIHPDNSVTVTDNGRGIPIDTHPEENKTGVELVMTKLHAGGKFDNKAYQVSGGLHGVGVSVVNALSEKLEVTVERNGGVYKQTYKRGVPQNELKKTGESQQTGTKISFRPDPEIFEEIRYNHTKLKKRLRELAFLNKGLQIKLKNQNTNQKTEFHYEGGIKSFVKKINEKKQPLHPEPIYFHEKKEDKELEIAIQYTNEYTENIYTFANNINTKEGGTHLSGFKSALTRTINKLAKQENIINQDEKLKGTDVREGITAVVSIKLQEPQFEGQTKTKLGNSEVRGIVRSIVNKNLKQYLIENPKKAKKIYKKAEQAMRAREAAKEAKQLTRRKTALETTTLPGKLADCTTKDKDKAELFVVEGDSAGGCFTGETEIQLASGRTATFKELVREKEKTHYCFTVMKNGSIGIEEIKNPRLTKKDADLVEVKIDNREVIECTPDHEFMLRSGRYKEARNLEPGDSLMPLYTKKSDLSREGNAIDDNEIIKQQNHKVISVSKKDRKADVYDIEVPRTHNFALASGIFVHNSAKQARDREFQAILPLKGKILNAEKARLDKILENKEIKSLIKAIGTGIGEEFDISKRRYNKIITMSVDGDDQTLVKTPSGEIKFTKIGDFIDEAIAKNKEINQFKVLCFDKDTLKTKFKQIKDVIRHELDEDLYEITTQYGRKIRATSSHSVFVYENGEIKLKKGENIKPGDKVVAPRKLPSNEKNKKRIDVLEELIKNKEKLRSEIYARGEGVEELLKERIREEKEEKEITKKRVRLTKNARSRINEKRKQRGLTQKQVCRKIGVKQPITLSEWERGIHRPPLDKFEKLCETIDISLDEIRDELEINKSRLEEIWEEQYNGAPKNRVRDYIRISDLREEDLERIPEDAEIEITPEHYRSEGINRYIDVDESLMELLGIYTGNESFSPRNGIRVASSNKEIRKHYQKVFKEVFGIKGKIYESDIGVGEVKLLNRVAALVWEHVFGISQGKAEDKEIPNIVFNTSNQNKCAFLRGYLKSDGTIGNNIISWTTVSEDLASGLMYLLSTLGVTASHRVKNPNKFNLKDRDICIKTKQKQHTITISSGKDLEKIKETWASLDKSEKLERKFFNKGNRKFKKLSDNLMALEVKNVEKTEPTTSYVYDFSVEKDENFVAGFGGICAHNTDADVDGAHITTLLLTFLYRYMKPLIEEGMVYIAKPPLYQIKKGNKSKFVYTEEQKNELLDEWSGGSVQRYKGLGEMSPKQLWETTMNPENRILMKVRNLDDIAADEIFNILMGKKVAPRKNFIMENASEVSEIDI